MRLRVSGARWVRSVSLLDGFVWRGMARAWVCLAGACGLFPDKANISFRLNMRFRKFAPAPMRGKDLPAFDSCDEEIRRDCGGGPANCANSGNACPAGMAYVQYPYLAYA